MNQGKAIALARMIVNDEGGPYQTVAIELAKYILMLSNASPTDQKRNDDNKNDAHVGDLRLHSERSEQLLGLDGIYVIATVVALVAFFIMDCLSGNMGDMDTDWTRDRK